MSINVITSKKTCNDPASTITSKSQKTALKTAWNIISWNKTEHARNVISKFFEQNPNHLMKFFELRSGEMGQKTLLLIASFEVLIETGLSDQEVFNFEIQQIYQQYIQIINMKDIEEINKIIADYLRAEMSDFMTKTLDEALQKLFEKIESSFSIYINSTLSLES